MKVHLKNILGLAALGVALLANTGPTWAGSVSTPEVIIGGQNHQVYSWAKGSMVGARYSTDSQQYIGCFMTAQPTSSSPSIRCFARDRAGNTAFCVSIDLRHVRQVQAMTDSSHILFIANRATANCDTVNIANSSAQIK